MDILIEFIGELVINLWGLCAEKMWDPSRSRTKRIIFFILFYIPLAVLLSLFGVLAYERTNILRIVLAYAFFALALFLFFFLGRRAWLGRDFKVPKAVEKAEENVGNFFTAYRNTLGDRNAPLKTRILLFSLMFAPLFALAIFLIVAVEELLWLGCIGLVVFTVCTLIWAKRIFGKKK
ncbi:MAG: hypothetical protein IJ021_03545 [Clostridia bacterium]|nr:hypothetical protein [Clostridia bacterium]